MSLNNDQMCGKERRPWKGSRHCSAGWTRAAESCFSAERGEHGRDPGFPQRGRPVPPAVPVSPETILSRSFFDRQPEEFYRFYRSKMLCLDAKPNAAHKKLAELECGGRLRSVVTQNIDGLHQAAGSRRVWELHGSVLRNRCMSCGRPWPVSAVAESAGVPRCTCGGVIKPDVVLYEESLEAQVLEGALEDIRQADLLIIGGTSLVVYPAAGLVNYYRGDRLALINKSPTPYDRKADLVLTGSIGEILGQIQVR